jgi:arylsulfatase A-like enzyme
MDPRELTIGDLLRHAGYRTGIVGKWHLGNSSSCIQPGDRGFDRYFVIPKCGGSNGYLNQTYLANSLDPIKTEGYATEIFAERAIDFIRESAGKDQPFFLYLSFNAPHAPFIAPQKYLDRVPNLTGDRRAVAAMILAVDDAIGRVMQTLEEKGVSRNTLVFLLNDNGALASRVEEGVNSQGPFRGGKNGFSEGGLRTPFVVRWPERLPAGKKFLHPVWSLDIVPTCVAVAGHTLPKDRPFDGVDLMPYLRSEKSGVPHEILYWRVGKPLRIGDWKFAGHFYHLRDDPGEANLLHGRKYHAMEYQARRISEYIRQQIEVDGPVSFAEFDLSLYFLGTEEER